jgi:hypothetical protein
LLVVSKIALAGFAALYVIISALSCAASALPVNALAACAFMRLGLAKKTIRRHTERWCHYKCHPTVDTTQTRHKENTDSLSGQLRDYLQGAASTYVAEDHRLAIGRPSL